MHFPVTFVLLSLNIIVKKFSNSVVISNIKHFTGCIFSMLYLNSYRSCMQFLTFKQDTYEH